MPEDATRPPMAVPERFVALVLDDVHFEMNDAVAVREAGAKHPRSVIAIGAHGDIYDFRHDQSRLHQRQDRVTRCLGEGDRAAGSGKAK